MSMKFLKQFGFVLLSILSVLFVQVSFAQTTNPGIFFQAVAKDNYSNPAKDRKIYVQSSILQATATGTAVLTEIHETTTDAAGVFSISIGQGTRTGGSATSLSAVPWAQGPFFLSLKIAITPTAPIANWDFSKDFIDLGTTPFGTVPYALYAGSVAGLDAKLNASDTTKMLSNYAKVDNINSLVINKVNIADSATVYVTPAQLKKNTSDLLVLANNVTSNTNSITTNTSAINLKANIASPTFSGVVTAPSFVKSGGTSSQYLMADGSVTTGSGSSSVNLGTGVTGILPLANGGTGVNNINGFKTALGLLSNNIAIGSQAGTANQGVNANTVALGYAAGQYSQGSNAVALGAFAGNNSQVANSIAINASGLSLNPSNAGFYVNPIRTASPTTNLLYYNTSTNEVVSATPSLVDLISDQTIAGIKTFSANINVNGISVGRGNGNNDESVAVGSGAMASSNVNGKRNTAIGSGAMAQYNGTSWDNNTSVGYHNMPNMTSGSANTSVGAESMLYLLTGVENTSIGNQSLINVTGNSNVGVGKRAGQTISTGSQNTIIGTDADVSTNNLSNATALGYGAIVAASNTIQLGNTSVTNVNTSGTIKAGAITYPNTDGTANQVLTTNGNGVASWSSPLNISITNISNSSNANGATITSGVLSLTPADASNGGIVTTGVQNFGGIKTFNNAIAVGASTIDPSAVLDISSTTKGLLLPRLTTAQRDAITNPAVGLTVYNTTTGSVESYLGKTSSLTEANTTDRGGWYAPVSPSSYDPMMHFTRPAYSAGQSFVPTTTNSITDIEVYVNNIVSSGTFNLKLYAGSGTSGTLLSTQSVSFSNAGFQKLTLITPVALTAGQAYTFELSPVTGNINIGLNDNYANGNFFQNGNNGGNDLRFNLYYSSTVGSWKGNATASSASLPSVDGTAGQVLTTDGNGNASWSSPSRTTITSISSSSNANGATITSGVLSLTPADETNGGIVTNGTQIIGGDKTIKGKLQIGAGSSNASAALDVQSANQGFLPPRMTGAQRDAISSPAQGLMIYCTNCGNNGEWEGYNGTNWTNMIGGATSAIILKIGDNYQGGIIGYILQAGDPGYDPNVQHGFIVTANDIASSAQWGCQSTANVATSTSLGTGQSNTTAIINACPVTGTAAYICDNLVLNGYSDWYLPSRDELNKIYLNRAIIGAFTHVNYYWCSSQCSSRDATGFGFDNGDNGYGCGTKSDSNNVRAFRNF